MSDNQSADMLGCYGNAELVTPHLDALARDGVRFDEAYCVNAMCSPCRASVLTGLMPSRHGVHNWLDDGLADRWPEKWNAIGEFETFPQRFKDAGYQTALIGKFHLGEAQHRWEAFDHWVTFPHGHTVSFRGNEMFDNGERFFCEGHSVEYFTDKTVEFIEQRSAPEQPFFAFVPYNGPYGHWPAIKGESGTEFDAVYEHTPMASIPREGLNADVVRRFALRVLEAGGMPHERFMGPLLLPNHVASLRNYYAQISLIDAGVGRILETLRARGELQNTIVVYTADHGFSLGNHGIWGHGMASWPSTLHRASTRIPLIITWPAQLRAHNRTAAVGGLNTQLDLGPTLLELAGLTPSLNAPSPARSFATGLARGRPARNAVYLEQEETRAIRTDEWLLMHRFDGAPSYPLTDSLYNVSSDVSERAPRDCADEPYYASLKGDLQAFFEQHSDPRYDLWRGGSVKSNCAYSPLWRDAWGADWAPQFLSTTHSSAVTAADEATK